MLPNRTGSPAHHTLPASPTSRLAWNTGGSNAGEAIARGGCSLRGRRRRKRRISHRSSGHRCLSLFLTFGLDLIFQLLHVAVGVVLQRRLRRLAFSTGLLSWG